MVCLRILKINSTFKQLLSMNRFYMMNWWCNHWKTYNFLCCVWLGSEANIGILWPSLNKLKLPESLANLRTWKEAGSKLWQRTILKAFQFTNKHQLSGAAICRKDQAWPSQLAGMAGGKFSSVSQSVVSHVVKIAVQLPCDSTILYLRIYINSLNISHYTRQQKNINTS